MLYLQNCPIQALRTPTVTTATNSTAVVFFDQTANGGVAEALLKVTLGPASATNISAGFATLNIVESDTTNQADFTTILQGTTGTPTDSQFSLEVWNNTSIEQVNSFSVPILGRKRHIGVVATPNHTNNRAVGVEVITAPREGVALSAISSGVNVVVS